MGLSSLPAEVLISLIAILIAAAVGCITSLLSWTRISEQTKGVKQAEAVLTGDSTWEDAYPHDKLKLAVWLREKGIKPDSHLGDFIRTCWSAWLGGRPASLTELHVLVARRERGYGATRLSSGIAALLLVFGIVGTLSSIKPVLHEFKFSLAEESNQELTGGNLESLDSDNQAGEKEFEKDAASVAANTELVNTLIHNLGNAFWPSLLALIGTIAVVSCRGLYTLALHKFALELDRFAVDTLIPRYRVPSLSEQYQEVKTTLTSVTEVLLQREERFHVAVENLENMVKAISPALTGLDLAAVASRSAAEVLSSRAQSITDGLTRHLGTKSPIHRAIAGFEGVFEKTEKSLGNLASVVDGIGQATTKSQGELESAIQALTKSVGRIAEDHQTQQVEAKSALEGFKSDLAGIPEIIRASSVESTGAGLKAVKSSVSQLHEEQKKWHSASSGDLKAATVSGLSGVAKAGQDLVALGERVATTVSDIGNIKEDAKAAFKELTDAGKTQITQSGDATKSKIEATSAKLAREVNEIGLAVERLSKLQPEIPNRSASRQSVIPNRKEGSRNVIDRIGSQNRVDTESTLVPLTDPMHDHKAAPVSAHKMSRDIVENSGSGAENHVSDRSESVEVTDANEKVSPPMQQESVAEPRIVPSVDSNESTLRSSRGKKWFQRNPFSRKQG